MIVSHREAKQQRAHTMIEEALKNETPIKGTIVRVVKGGVIVEIGTTAFLPASQIDSRRD